MAMLAANTIYLTLDSVDVKAKFTKVNLEISNDSQEITAGSGTTYTQRAAGLNDATLKVTLGYDAANVSTYVQKLKAGSTYAVEFGPEGNTTGKPRHVQSMLLENTSFEVNVKKSLVEFDLSFVGADAPTVDIFSGGVYS